MIKKKYLMILSIAVVSVLLGSLFVSNVILAQSGGEYDPWLDCNDDGKIDIYDLAALASVYGASGEPINKTALLLDLLARVEALENQSLPQGFIGSPAYDSGWTNIGMGESIDFTHNLGTAEIFIHVMTRHTGYTPPKIHNIYYGGCGEGIDAYGVFYQTIDDNRIRASRWHADYASYQVRIMIWKIQEHP